MKQHDLNVPVREVEHDSTPCYGISSALDLATYDSNAMTTVAHTFEMKDYFHNNEGNDERDDYDPIQNLYPLDDMSCFDASFDLLQMSLQDLDFSDSTSVFGNLVNNLSITDSTNSFDMMNASVQSLCESEE
jgi:hypothetical protein